MNRLTAEQARHGAMDIFIKNNPILGECLSKIYYAISESAKKGKLSASFEIPEFIPYENRRECINILLLDLKSNGYNCSYDYGLNAIYISYR